MALVFDIETDGLLDSVTKIHSLVIYDTEQDKLISCTDNDKSYTSIKEGIELLRDSKIVGHNIVKYDIPVIQKLYPDFNPKVENVFDTLLMSKLVYPDISEWDFRLARKGTLPKKLIGKYSLEAFGYRLKELKGEYCKQEDAWDKWSKEMQDYCEQDVKVTTLLYNKLLTKEISPTAILLEHQFAKVIGRQEQRGAYFDKEKAIDLAGKLKARQQELTTSLRLAFPTERIETKYTPKVNNKAKGYVKGQEMVKVTYKEFNPSSRQDIGQRLIKKYKWKPKVLTDTGLPKISEETLSELPYPETKLLSEYFITSKVLGYLSDGDNAWLKLMDRAGVIHGGVDTIGAVTGRCTHQKPNLANIPSPRAMYGKECRQLFGARAGYTFVGCDASGLELRMLAHYMNDPDYTHEILNGDIHTANQKAAGLPTRDNAKTFIYGFLYGAGDEKIGSITGKGATEGKKIKKKFLQSLPKLKKLLDGVKHKIETKGFLKGIDGRHLKVREAYKGLNVLLQSAGAIVMKKALSILYDDCVAKGWIKDSWYLTDADKLYWILNVHDEYQAEVEPEIVEEYKIMAVEAIKKAGEFFNMRCPLDGEAKTGANWYDTH